MEANESLVTSVCFCEVGDMSILIMSHTCSKTLAAYHCLHGRAQTSCIWYLSLFLISTLPPPFSSINPHCSRTFSS